MPEGKDKLLMSGQDEETHELEWKQVDKSEVAGYQQPVDKVEDGNLNAVTSNAVNNALTNRKQILIRDYIFSNQYDATVFNVKYSTLKLPNVKPEGMFVVSNSSPHGFFCGGRDFTDTQFTLGYRYFYSVPFSVTLKLAFIYDANTELS